MSNEAPKCPFSHELVATPMPIVPLESGKRPEKKERPFGNYPPVIQYLGLLMLGLGITNEENARGVLDEHKVNNIRIWFQNIENHSLYLSKLYSAKLKNLLNLEQGIMSRRIAKVIFPDFPNFPNYPNFDSFVSHTSDELISYVDCLCGIVIFIRKAVLTSAIDIAKSGDTSQRQIDRYALEIFNAFEKIVKFKLANLPMKISNITNDDFNLIHRILRREISTGVNFLIETRADDQIVHPKYCQVKKEDSLDPSKENHRLYNLLNSDRLEYTRFQLLEKYTDDQGRIFYKPSACPFTTAIPGVKEF